MSAPATWRATYRLQLSATFTFDDAVGVVPHLADLGVSHLYLSPVLEAAAGSTHGYDGTDPTRVSEERGGEAGLRRLADAAHQAGLGVLVDIVPNHLAVGEATPWWADEANRPRMFDYDPSTGWYRRFFDIDSLAGLRQEDPEVFDASHAKVLQLVHDGTVDGLRVDHPDGLADPAGYLDRLHRRASVPIWVEKILEGDETLRPWPVAGTVGYEFASDATRLFVDPAGEATLTATYRDLTGDGSTFAAVAHDAKREQLAWRFAGELDRLAALSPDVPPAVLAEVITRLGIYRTYVDPATRTVTDADRAAVTAAVEAAGAPASLARRLLLDEPGYEEFVRRFQQTTPAVTAKGVEDTAMYRSIRLLAANEVGADPDRITLPVEAFHARCLDRAAAVPLGLLAATTHDTKRSADSRARIGAVVSMAAEFDVLARRWFMLSEVVDQHLTEGGAPGTGPTPRELWLLIQTLLGSWPITRDRLDDHLVKALREAGETTSWREPDRDHEARMLLHARALMTLPAFEAEFLDFAERVAAAGEWAAVGQTLLRATTPGICDIYQGDESWFLSLVDPDNRRTTDWRRRFRLLERVRSGAEPTRSTAKLHVLHHALVLRAQRPDSFAPGAGYVPLPAGGSTVAFLRGNDDILVAVRVRPDAGARVTVPAGLWRDALGRGGAAAGGERHLAADVAVADLVGPLRVGLWERR